MYKMPANLMMINKIIIFSDSMIEEDINEEFFSEKLIFDIEFINKRLSDFWDEYLKFIDIYERDNFIKSYSSVLKRFYKLLHKIKEFIPLTNNFYIDERMTNGIIENIRNRINLIKDHRDRLKLVNTEKQIINEEEYSMLFENFEEEPVT
ncbi:MAG: hypothetical protein KAT05_08720 [Spirochaetes bacterium]|nr:hypothetical protein [Spirochaetota bacterium]